MKKSGSVALLLSMLGLLRSEGVQEVKKKSGSVALRLSTLGLLRSEGGQEVKKKSGSVFLLLSVLGLLSSEGICGLPDKTVLPNKVGEGINKSLVDEIGSGRGSFETPFSSLNIINHDPFRSVRRGRQLFQRKFTRAQGQGPLAGGVAGDINTEGRFGAGLGDSCSSCHGRPRGSAGFGGDVATHPDSRDAPHLFGLGLKEMLADEMTATLRGQRDAAVAAAAAKGKSVTARLYAKGVKFGRLTASPDGKIDTSQVEGVDPDLRVKPFFVEGSVFSIRSFIVTAFQNELGMQPVDSDLQRAAKGERIVTPVGMVIDGATDPVPAPIATSEDDDPDGDGVKNEIPQSLVDHEEMYLLNYFKAGLHEQNSVTRRGKAAFFRSGCASCHVPSMTINKDRRVADVETNFDPVKGGFNRLFATASPLFEAVNVPGVEAPFKRPLLQKFVVNNFYSDLKRHDLGPNFHERQYDGSIRTSFLTTPLWGVGSTAPYGHDGRSMNLTEVILRHGGEAQSARDEFADLSVTDRICLTTFLQSLVLFPPDDTASNLNPTKPDAVNYPQNGHGSIRLPVLFNDPLDLE